MSKWQRQFIKKELQELLISAPHYKDHRSCHSQSNSKKKLHKLKISDFRWTRQRAELTGQTTIPRIWSDRCIQRDRIGI